jgi:hypothetical protein
MDAELRIQNPIELTGFLCELQRALYELWVKCFRTRTGRAETNKESSALPAVHQRRTARAPKSNRMPDALHSVKVETQVVDGI